MLGHGFSLVKSPPTEINDVSTDNRKTQRDAGLGVTFVDDCLKPV